MGGTREVVRLARPAVGAKPATWTAGRADSLRERAMTIYVDGSGRSGPRRGGIGIRFAWIDDRGDVQVDEHALPSTEGATNNQMELEAPSEALRMILRGRLAVDLARFEKIVIRSDSRYVCDNIGAALYRWPKTKWRTADGRAVLNVQDWKNLTSLMRRLAKERHLRVEFEWQPGKVGEHAKRVDQLAKQSSSSASFGRGRPTNVRRKTTRTPTEVGSVRPEGQQVRIRVVEARFLSRDETRYRYEVVDAASAFCGNVDFADSSLQLGPGHTYDVRLNDDPRNPRLVEALAEIEEDLTPFLAAVSALGVPSSATDVATELGRSMGHEVGPVFVKRRLDRLVDELGKLRRTRATFRGRPYLYEPARVNDHA